MAVAHHGVHMHVFACMCGNGSIARDACKVDHQKKGRAPLKYIHKVRWCSDYHGNSFDSCTAGKVSKAPIWFQKAVLMRKTVEETTQS